MNNNRNFINNRNNVVKKDNNKKIASIIVVILAFMIVATFLCSTALLFVYTQDRKNTTHTAYADWTDFPSDYPNLFLDNFITSIDIGGSYASLTVLSPYSFKIDFNIMPQYRNLQFFNFTIDSVSTYTTFFNFYNLPNGITVDYVLVNGLGHFLNPNGLETYSYSTTTNGFMIHLSVSNDYVFSPFTLYCSCGLWNGDFTLSDFAQNIYYQIGQMDGFYNGYDIGQLNGYNDGLNVGYNNAINNMTFKADTFFRNSLVSWQYYPTVNSQPVILASNVQPSFSEFNNSLYFINLPYDSADLPSNLDSCLQNVILTFNNTNYVNLSSIKLPNSFNSLIVKIIGNKSGVNLTEDFVLSNDGSLIPKSLTTYTNFDYIVSLIITNQSADGTFITDFHYYLGSIFVTSVSVNELDAVRKNAYDTGYSVGYNTGVAEANNYSFLSLTTAVVDAPVQVFSQLLNFNILGFNLLDLFLGLLTLAVVIFIVKKVIF